MDRRILYVQYTNPAAGYPPLEHSSHILANAGWQVLFLGTGAFGHADTFRFTYHSKIHVKQMSFCPGGWRQKLHYLLFSLWVFAWAIFWRPQWVYASDLFSCPISLVLSFLPGLRVIYHEHVTPYGFSHNIFTRFCLKMRCWLAHRAKLCVIPSLKRAKNFSEEMRNGNKVICVWNCPAQEEISPARPPLKENNLWVLYHGSIVPSRLPVTVLEALALLPDRVKLSVVGYDAVGYRKYIQELKEVSSHLALRHRVNFVGALPTRRDLFEYCRRCDVGLTLMPKKSFDINEQTMSDGSNKPFDYLANGLAVLVSDLADWTELYVEPGYGLACDPEDPQSIADALRWFLDHPQEMREMGERGRQRILREWNYEQAFEPVLRELCAS